jgi:hypothetical protein
MSREMSNVPLLDNPAHWRKRAVEAMANADQLTDLAARAMMLDIGGGYENLALRAEGRRRDQNGRHTASASEPLTAPAEATAP